MFSISLNYLTVGVNKNILTSTPSTSPTFDWHPLSFFSRELQPMNNSWLVWVITQTHTKREKIIQIVKTAADDMQIFHVNNFHRQSIKYQLSLICHRKTSTRVNSRTFNQLVDSILIVSMRCVPNYFSISTRDGIPPIRLLVKLSMAFTRLWKSLLKIIDVRSKSGDETTI